MTKTLTRPLTTTVPFTFVREGRFYFSRRVPRDIRHHYRCDRIVRALGTASPSEARRLASLAAARLDAFWRTLRPSDLGLIGADKLVSPPSGQSQPQQPQTVPDVPQPTVTAPSAPTLTEAKDLYVRQKGEGRAKTFAAAAERSTGYLIEVCGNKALTAYTRADALRFRDALIARKMSGSTVTRNLAHVKAVINFALSEHAIDIRNPFTNLYFDRERGVTDREPVPLPAIRRVQAECRRVDDELRWLIALISDTGLRLAEAAGLLKSDIFLGPHPHIKLVKHPWRSLKTKSSERIVPLAGAALWAAERVLASTHSSRFAFPRYNTRSTTDSNAASAALNKWMAAYVPKGCTLHGFRHSMRDRLRAVQCASDLIDNLGGWATAGVGTAYGSGYPISVLHEWMTRAIEDCPASLSPNVQRRLQENRAETVS